MNPLNGSAQRLSKFMVQDDAGAPFEERVPFGTPDWALYGSIPARAVSHVLARPVLDAMEHTHNVLTGKVDPWADLGPTGMMAGLVAGGGLVPGAAPRGAMRTGFSGPAKAIDGHLAQQSGHPFIDQWPKGSEQALSAKDLVDAVSKGHSLQSLESELDFLNSQLGGKPSNSPYFEVLKDFVPWAKKNAAPTLKPFGEQEFMTHGGEYADTYTDPAHIAAAALHHAGGDAGKAHDLLMGQIGKWIDQGEDPEAFHFAIDALRDAKGLPQLHALSPQDIAYVNSIPEQSNINPYKALADFKAGKISELPQHQYKDDGLGDWSPEVEAAYWEPSDTAKAHAVLGTHPLDKSVMAPSVLRRPIPQAITPYEWELSSNAAPQARGFNINHPLGHWMLDDPRLARDALDMGFNLAHPIYKGMDPAKWIVPEVPWEAAMANPANREASRGKFGLASTPVDLFGEAFSHPGPGRGKERENALFGADTPIVSDEYTKHWGGLEHGAQNAIGWLRSNKAGQVFWPEINHGRRGYDSTVMHNAILEALAQDYDLLALHGMDDLGGTHTQYAWATPEQFRAIGAQFNPQYRDFPNMLLTQGNPFGVQFLEPEDDRSNPLARKGRTRTQTGR